MIDLVIVYLALIVVILLSIIAFLTLYIIHERRKTTIVPLHRDKRIVLPLFTLKTHDKSSGDHSTSATRKRTTKRLRYRSPTLVIRTPNSQGFLLTNSDLSMPPDQKLFPQHVISTLDQTTIDFDYERNK